MPQTLTPFPTVASATSRLDDADDTVAIELGDQLKTMFDRLTIGPMPKRLLDLADALEEAFQRGDLFDNSAPCTRSRAS